MLGKFLENKKLQLLKLGIINISQFINLIDITDPYTVIGPAIVDKQKIEQFLHEWREEQLKYAKDGTSPELTPFQSAPITQQDIIKKLPELIYFFPEIESMAKQFLTKLNSKANCPTCEKNKYILLILGSIRQLYDDGRDLGDIEPFIEVVLNKYYPATNKIIAYNHIEQFDVDWIKPDIMVALGNDLIQGLSACFDCAKKHISRAKAFYEEWLTRIS